MTRCYNENWVQDTLAGAPYRLFFAKNGAEALRLVADYRPAVVITNWEMPDFTGVELCAEMRRDQDHYTYIILLTSNT